MSWHRFKVKGKHYMTKRMRTIDVIARSDTAAKQKAITKKLLPPFSCEEISFDPPTKTTINNAQKAGIEIPTSASNDDILSIIAGRNDVAPAAGLMAFAERWDIYFSQYISNRNLYNLLFKDLLPINKAAFFIFSIYKFLSNDKKSNLEMHPYKDIFYKFAANALDDKRLLRSITNYQGEQLCYFGKTIDAPTNYKAGSTNTIAYKAALIFIKDNFSEKFLPLTINDDKPVQPLKKQLKPAIVSKKSPINQPVHVNNDVNTKKEIIPEKSASKNPSVFILSKTDYSVPAGALKLKKQIINIPDLEEKALSDLPVYNHNDELVILPQINIQQPLTTIDVPAKQSGKAGCLTFLIISLLIAIMIFSFLF